MPVKVKLDKKQADQTVKPYKPKTGHLQETQWRPRQSGNPYGRPKRTITIAGMLRKMGDEKVGLFDIDKRDKIVATRLDHMLRGVYYEALYNHEPWAVNYISERTEGKVKEVVHQIFEDITIDVEDEPESPVAPSPSELPASDVYDDNGDSIAETK